MTVHGIIAIALLCQVDGGGFRFTSKKQLACQTEYLSCTRKEKKKNPDLKEVELLDICIRTRKI